MVGKDIGLDGVTKMSLYALVGWFGYRVVKTYNVHVCIEQI